MSQHCLVAPKPMRMLAPSVILRYGDTPSGDLAHDADYPAAESVVLHTPTREDDRLMVDRTGVATDIASELDFSPPARSSNPIVANSNFECHTRPLAEVIFNPCKKLMTWNTRLCTSI